MSTNILSQYHNAVQRLRVKLALWGFIHWPNPNEIQIKEIRRVAVLVCQQEPGIEPDELLRQYLETIRAESAGLQKPITEEKVATVTGQTTAVPLPDGVFDSKAETHADGVQMFMSPEI